MERIRDSRYAAFLNDYTIMDWESDIVPEYIQKNFYVQDIVRFRTGNEFEMCKFWKDSNAKICKLCKVYPETPLHVVEECTKNKYKTSCDLFFSSDGFGVAYMKGILCRRKRLQTENKEVKQK